MDAWVDGRVIRCSCGWVVLFLGVADDGWDGDEDDGGHQKNLCFP